MLCETWVEEKDVEGVRRRLSKGFSWNLQVVRRDMVKGRCVVRMISGVRVGIKEEEGKKGREEDGVMLRKIRMGRERVT